MTDKRGRRVHPEDAEARAVAQEQSRKRREKPTQSQLQKKQEPQPQQAVPAQPKPAKKQRNRPKPSPAEPIRPEEPVLSPEEDVGNYADLIRHRATSRHPERKPYSAAALDELLALPDFADELGYDKLGKSQPKRPKPLSGGKVMDATARMFLRGSTQPQEESAPGSNRSSRRKKRGGSPALAASGAAAAPAGQSKQEEASSGKGSSRKGASKQQAQTPKARKQTGGTSANRSKAAAVLTQPKAAPKPGPKAGPRHARPLPKVDQPAGDASRSLVRPYYLSDKKGKRG